MTKILCYADSYLKEFDATVTETAEQGVVLDQTAFYPGGGGQPSDTGALRTGDAEYRVVKLDRSEGRLVHQLDATPPEAGVVVYTADELDIAAVAEGMVERGHFLGRGKKPSTIHHLMEPTEDDRFLNGYLASLAEVVGEVRSGARTAQGVEVVYG